MEKFNEFLKHKQFDIRDDTISIDLLELGHHCIDLLTTLLDNPMSTAAEMAIVAQLFFKEKQNRTLRITFEHFPMFRMYNLSRVPRCESLGKLICFSGVVTKASSSKMHEAERVYECSRCHNIIYIEYDLSLNDIPKPSRCANKRNDGSLCGSNNFTQLANESAEFVDYQEIRVQERIDSVDYERIPRSITVVIEKLLVDKTKPGDRVQVIGVVRSRWKKLVKGERCQTELFIVANNIIILNNVQTKMSLSERHIDEFTSFWRDHDEIIGRNFIISQFAPKIYGMNILKLVIMMTLVGGTAKTEGSMKIRGDSHILLAGEPGTGKSEFLKFAAKLVPRAICTTGIGSTTAGLTCSAVRDGSEWVLEAGALVLADNGICCIDEFSSIKEADKTAIHEAMEQQSISVAKAGLVCKLNTRCSIIAASNPKGNYDQNQTLEVNLALGSPLLSRFDLVFVIIDRKDSCWDRTVSDFVLTHQQLNNSLEGWNVEKLKMYIEYCRQYQPEMMPESEKILREYYQHQRRTDHMHSARTTIRLLESLIRLAQSHARLMCRSTVEKTDALAAVCLMESSVLNSGLVRLNVFSQMDEFDECMRKLNNKFI